MQVREKGMELITLTVSWVGGLTVVAPALPRERGLNFAWEKNTHSFGAVKNSSENMTLGLPQPPFTCAYHSLCMFYWLFTETLLCCACFTGYLLRLCYAVHVSLVIY